jgi:hypothetical protein
VIDEKLILHLTGVVEGAKLLEYQKIWLETLLVVRAISFVGKDRPDNFLVPLAFVKLSQEVAII